MDKKTLQTLVDAQKNRKAVALVTNLKNGEQELVEDGEVIRTGKSGVSENQKMFTYVVKPAPRLVIVGAVHIAQYLGKLAQDCGFEVTIVDPREAFATNERFEGVNLIADWPETIWEELGVDEHTAVVTLAHDPKIDDYPLSQALGAGCFYVGALGSKKTNAKRAERLGEQGVDGDELERIHAPVGLDIGASGAAEIAVAIMAEIVRVMRKGKEAMGNPK